MPKPILESTELYLASDPNADEDMVPRHADEPTDIVALEPNDHGHIKTLHYARMVEGNTQEVAERMIACWNAFEGIPTEDIKPVSVA